MTVAITRKEPGAVGLRREARRCRDTAASRRMLALALVREGASREEAARAGGMDRQGLRDWAPRYNEGGGGGAGGRHGPAAPRGLGAPLQRGATRRPAPPAPVGAQAGALARAAGRA